MLTSDLSRDSLCTTAADGNLFVRVAKTMLSLHSPSSTADDDATGQVCWKESVQEINRGNSWI